VKRVLTGGEIPLYKRFCRISQSKDSESDTSFVKFVFGSSQFRLQTVFGLVPRATGLGTRSRKLRLPMLAGTASRSLPPRIPKLANPGTSRGSNS